jgi:hypothetical protein
MHSNDDDIDGRPGPVNNNMYVSLYMSNKDTHKAAIVYGIICGRSNLAELVIRRFFCLRGYHVSPRLSYPVGLNGHGMRPDGLRGSRVGRSTWKVPLYPQFSAYVDAGEQRVVRRQAVRVTNVSWSCSRVFFLALAFAAALAVWPNFIYLNSVPWLVRSCLTFFKLAAPFLFCLFPSY